MQKTQNFEEALATNGIFFRLYNKQSKDLPLLMIMGYGGCMFAWPEAFINRLAETRPVLIFDNRGTGRSNKLDENTELRIEQFADDLKGVLDFLSISDAHLFGYSMGGCVALEFARKYAALSNRVVLQSTTAGGKLYTGSDPEVKDRLANPRGNNFDEMLFDFFDLCMQADGVRRHRKLLDDICTKARPYPTPPRVLIPQLMAFRHFDASTFAAQLSQEFLVLHGESDRILKVENGRSLAQTLNNASSEFISNCGHCPHIESEELVVNRLERFLIGQQ